MRDYLSRLEKSGCLIRIDEELDPKFEVSAVLRLLEEKQDQDPAVLFKKIKGYNIPVAGNLFSSEKKIAIALGVEEGVLWDEYQKRLRSPLPPVLVDKGPVQEVVIKEGIDIQKVLPVLTYHERDVSPYITQGVTFLRDPDSGQTTMGVHRIQVKGKDKLGYYCEVGSATSYKFLENAKRRGKPLPVAIAIGVEPAILLAAISPVPIPVYNKLELAGGLRGKPVEVVKAKTADIEVPANAMFIIEGEISPEIKEPDGPFGESLGYYTKVLTNVINVKTITHQTSPVYSVFRPFPLEDGVCKMIEMQLKGMLKAMVPALKEIAFYFTGGLLVMSIEKKNAWDARHALYAGLTIFPVVKYAIVVDNDIDGYNLGDVMWALAGRCQPDRNMLIVSDVLASELDPSHKEGPLTAKLGLDATKPLDQAEKFEKIAVPRASVDKATHILKKYLG